jgi:GT2 family glycosyltransferase
VEPGAPEISVVVPARDAARTLPRLLAALPDPATLPAHEVIVVDNGSLDETAALAAASPRVARTLRRPRGEGPGAARNAGADAARAERLAFIDADCWPAPGWLAAGLHALGHAEIVQGAVRPDPAAEPGPFARTVSVQGYTGLFESANLFVTRWAFERAGGFPAGLEATLPLPGGGAGAPFGEDVRFGWRAVRAGARAIFCAEAVVHHEVQPRTGGAFAAERLRRALFPALVAELPELRRAFLHRQWFLSARTAKFDLALAGLALATAVPRGPGRRALAGLATVPYGRELARTGRRWGASVTLWELAADALGAAALLGGSARARTLVL